MRLRFGTCVFDSELRELSRGGTRAPLTPKAFALLEMLIEARPQPIAREAIVARLWPDTVVEPGNLHNLVSEIRNAIGDDQVIRTIHRFGYAFDATGAVEESANFVAVFGDTEIALRPGENLIGRDPSCAISIDSAEVSRRHAQITIDGARVTIEDLGSKNGTFVGTRRVTEPAEVRSGDSVLVGTTTFVIRSKSALPSTKTVA